MRVRSNVVIVGGLILAALLIQFGAMMRPPTEDQGPLPITALATVTPVGGVNGQITPTDPFFGLVTVTPVGFEFGEDGQPIPTDPFGGLVTVTPIGFIEGADDPETFPDFFFITPTAAAPGCVQIFPLEQGATVTVRSGITLRYAPTVSAPLLTTVLSDRDFVIVDGPVCADEYVWWGVSSPEFTGWVAERNINITFFRDFSIPRPRACQPPTPLTVGQMVDTTFNVRVRQEPSIEALVLTVALTGTPVTILSDARCIDGFNWRQIRANVAGFDYEGWIVEGQADQPVIFLDAIDESAICYPPIAFGVGQRVRVYYRSGPPKNLRAAPGYDSDVLFSLVSGVPLEITGESVCIDAMNWWPVRVQSSVPVAGWIAEGGRPIPNIRPIDEPMLPFLGR